MHPKNAEGIANSEDPDQTASRRCFRDDFIFPGVLQACEGYFTHFEPR